MNADLLRIATLRKEIGMLRQVQRHISGIPARHNAIRIAEREDLLQTLSFLVELESRPDHAEVERKAAA